MMKDFSFLILLFFSLGILQPLAAAEELGGGIRTAEKEPAEAQSKKIHPSLFGVIQVEEPEGWTYTRSGDRWLRPDPGFGYWQGNDDMHVVHYGLENSDFKTLDQFLDWTIETLGKPESVEKVFVSGREGKQARFRYQYEGYELDHGGYSPPESIYEEFVAVPLDKGFLVFSLSIHRMWQFLPLPLSEKDPQAEKLRIAPVFAAWKRFLERVKITAGA